MNFLTIEQSKAAYWADFAIYGSMIVVLAIALVVGTPHALWPRVAFLGITGVVGWSVLEYLVHRFLFHGVQPFRRWHAEHHARPTAFICAPTLVTASVLGTFLFFTRLADGRRLECLRFNARRVVRLRCVRDHAPCHSPLACKRRMAATPSALAFHPPSRATAVLLWRHERHLGHCLPQRSAKPQIHSRQGFRLAAPAINLHGHSIAQ
jgi:hypothetical protein